MYFYEMFVVKQKCRKNNKKIHHNKCVMLLNETERREIANDCVKIVDSRSRKKDCRTFNVEFS